MPPFGNRFINLMDPEHATVGIDLGARLDHALDTAPPDGPLILYLSGQLELSRDLVLPERCQWFMGPGATLTLRHHARLEVLGPVDLGFEPRFLVDGAARVLLLGPLDLIRPEWWIGTVDTKLSLAAELVAERARRRREAVPVRLTGPYVLGAALDLTHAARGEPIGFEFLGRHPLGDAVLEPTLIRGPEMSSTNPLVLVQNVGPVRFAHVAFDTTECDQREVDEIALAPAVDGWMGAGDLEFVRCSFFGAKSIAVAARTTVGGDSPRVTARECWFQLGTALKIGHYGVRCTGDSRLRLDGCTFVGHAYAMVEVISGMVDLVGCMFDNQVPSSEDGVDIRITDPYPLFRIIDNGGPFMVTAKDAPRRPGSDVPVRGDPSRLAGPDVMVGPVQLNVIHVRTRSARHLYSTPVMRPTTVSLTGVVQEQATDQTGGALTPPSISWRASLTSAMLLQGCYFSGPIDVARPGYVLAVGALLEGIPATVGGTEVRWRYPAS